MTRIVRIVVPGKPQGKGRPRFSRATGRAFTPEPTVRYENLVRYAAHEAMAGAPMLVEALRLQIVAHIEVPASWSARKRQDALWGLIMPEVKPDFDNIAKIVDALNGVVWDDDKRVVDAKQLKVYAATPRLEIEVETYF